MQLRADALEGHLAKSLAPLYVISSDEHLLALEAADKIRKTARANGYTERDVLTVERSFKWGELLAANQALSLFGDKKIIELRIPTGKPGKDGGAALQSYAKDLSPDNLTLITLPKLDWQTAKAAWVGALQQAAVYIEIPSIERPALPNWIGVRLAAQGQSADREHGQGGQLGRQDADHVGPGLETDMFRKNPARERGLPRSGAKSPDRPLPRRSGP